MFNRVLKRAAQHYRLQARFQLLNSLVVIGGVIAAVPFWITWIGWLRLALGLPVGSGAMDGLVLQFFIWVVLTLVSLVAFFYAGILLAGMMAMLLLTATRSESVGEAIDFVLRSKYPARWFKSTT